MPCFFFQGSSQGATFLTASQEGFRLQLGAEQCICNPSDEGSEVRGRHLIKRFNAFEVHADLFSALLVVMYLRSRLYIGIDAHGHRSL